MSVASRVPDVPTPRILHPRREKRRSIRAEPCYIFSIRTRGAPSLTRDDPSAFAPPPAFGPFRVLHQIGVGALGPVFRTYEPTRDRLVAVKVFRLDIIPEQAHALADELGRAADAGLFHPSIVEPVAAGVEGTVAYRAEEYVAAESLDVAMRHYAPATLDKALPFITQLAGDRFRPRRRRRARRPAPARHLRHARRSPRHRLRRRRRARSGSACARRCGVRTARPSASPASPGDAADVFSLAAIAFELLTGRRPSGVGDDMGSLSGATLGDRADDVRTVLAKAMREKPSERYQTAQEFSAALAVAAGLAETPVSVAARVAVGPAAAVEPEIVRAPTEPLEPASELPLTFARTTDDGRRGARAEGHSREPRRPGAVGFASRGRPRARRFRRRVSTSSLRPTRRARPRAKPLPHARCGSGSTRKRWRACCSRRLARSWRRRSYPPRPSRRCPKSCLFRPQQSSRARSQQRIPTTFRLKPEATITISRLKPEGT